MKDVFMFTCCNCGAAWKDSKPATHRMDECPYCGSADLTEEKSGTMGFYAVEECPRCSLETLPKKEKKSKMERRKKREQFRAKKNSKKEEHDE